MREDTARIFLHLMIIETNKKYWKLERKPGNQYYTSIIGVDINTSIILSYNIYIDNSNIYQEKNNVYIQIL